MKIDEAISLLKQYIDYDNPDLPDFYTMEEACEVVIKALEQEPCDDAVSRQAVLEIIEREEFKGDALSEIEKLPPVTPQQKPNIKALGDDIRICQKSITDKKVLIGFNMAVALCNKYLAESEVQDADRD